MEQFISIDSHYTRSINLERDGTSEIIHRYIPTSRCLQILERITQTFRCEQTPRSFALIAPYGSGKSAFACFLNQLLAGSSQAQQLIATQRIDIAEQFKQHLENKKPYCSVLITGSPEPFSQRFLQALTKAVIDYWQPLVIKPEILKQLENLNHKEVGISEILKLIKQLQTALLEVGSAGLLIVVDEVGKFLEYEARHYGANDIYLLQALAEHAEQAHQVNMLCIVLMHQAFEQYGKNLSDKLKNEWQKVQGRYESISFLESSEQILRIIAKAFQPQLEEKQTRKIEKALEPMIEICITQNLLPASMDKQTALSLFLRCYPLHPVSLLLLPKLCQKFAQNERTLFSYLGSFEPHGFKDSLSKLNFGDWITPDSLYDYFIENQPTVISDPITHKRWAEVITALERLGNTDLQEIRLLKIIGLFNIISAQGSLKASRELLSVLVKDFQLNLQSLMNQSLVQYRKYSCEYRVWQGSDFDLEGILQQKLASRLGFNLAETLNQKMLLAPVVARKYSIESGTLRYFQPIFVEADNYQKLNFQENGHRIIFYLAQNTTERTLFAEKVCLSFSHFDICVLCNDVEKLQEVVFEVQALEKVLHECQELNNDPIAMYEVKTRLAAAQKQQQELLRLLLDVPENNEWYAAGKKLAFKNKRQLQQHLSLLLKAVYDKAPIVKNELINRNKLSSQAIAARNKLIAALLENTHLEDLDFAKDKYPPEKSIYRALFKATGIHRKVNGHWQLITPPKTNEFNFYPLWQVIERFFRQQQKPCALPILYQQLTQPPYGIKAGVLPLLFIAYYLVNHKDLALYEEGVFCAELDKNNAEMLVKRPELFTVEYFAITGMRAELLDEYLHTLIGKLPEQARVLDILRPLAKFMRELPIYTQKTKNLSPKTLAVRKAFDNTQSPALLLFVDLPKACGYGEFSEDSIQNESLAKPFLNTFVGCLKELKAVYPNLVTEFKGFLCQSLNLAEDVDLKTQIQQRFQGLEKFTVDNDLKAFISRLQNDKQEDAYLETIMTFLGKQPPQKWSSNHKTEAEYQLSLFAERLLDLEKLATHKRKITGENTKVMLLRLIGEEQEEINQPVYINEQSEQKINQRLQDIEAQFKDLSRDEYLGLIAKMLKNIQIKSN